MNHRLLYVFIAATFLLSSTLTAFCQTTKDVVYLKNGSIIKGTILEMVPNGNVKIETSDGSVFIYPMTEVEKTTKEEVKKAEVKPQPIVYQTVKKEDDFITPSGYFIITKFGPKLSVLEGEAIDISVGIINGYHVNKYLSLGLGIEAAQLSFGDNQNSSIPIYPIYLDGRFNIPKERVNPVFLFQFGYAFTGDATLSKNNGYSYYDDFIPSSGNGGLYMAVGAGFRVLINKTFAFVADGGFAFQSLEGNTAESIYDYNTSTTTTIYSPATETIPSLRLNVGLSISLGK
jgi:hypothetical protein